MTFKGAIFDLDGVIVDTVPLHFSAWQRLFQDDYGLHFDLSTYEQKVDGRPRVDAVKIMLPAHPLEEQKAAGDLKQSYYLEMLNSGKLKVFDSSLRFIESLLQQGVRIVAASSSRNATYILEKIDLLKDFEGVVSGNDIQHGKPHPEIFLKAADILQLPKNECIVFEDAKAGVEAAKAGDFFCVGIDRHHREEHFLKADVCVSDLGEINYIELNKRLTEDRLPISS
jgi:beta-phosphoglucomutase